MSNSYEREVKGLYSGIFADIRAALPTVRGLGRDESRLLTLIETRGLRFATVDLPSFGKHFDRCLADGHYTPCGLPGFGFSRRGGRGHAFLRGLILRVFDTDGVLLPNACVFTILALRQLSYAVKKIKIECTETVRDSTIERYIAQEQSLRSPSLNWHSDRFDCNANHGLYIGGHGSFRDGDTGQAFALPEPDAAFCGTVHDIADRVFASFGLFCPEEWRPKHGPGAVADRPIAGYKYNFPTWTDRLESVFPYADLAFANYGEWADTPHSKLASSEEVPAQMRLAPKTQKAPRIIAKEPTANMWCQQLVRDYLETNVDQCFLRDVIHFRNQSYNRDGALEASLTSTHWTVDLSDASDRVSLWLVERLLRSNKSLLAALHASRSRILRVPRKGGDVLLKMKKFAPQGSATTFPLQSIIYSIIALASVLYARGWSVSTATLKLAAKEVLVFGDDTIIPADAGERYVEMLTYLGFFVNPSKTYGTGRFRESCGCEAYAGVDVTPAYYVTRFTESSPSSIASVVECSNNFYKKGFWHTAAWLESTLPRWVRKDLAVRDIDDGRFGLTTYGQSRQSQRLRWNNDLHRYE